MDPFPGVRECGFPLFLRVYCCAEELEIEAEGSPLPSAWFSLKKKEEEGEKTKTAASPRGFSSVFPQEKEGRLKKIYDFGDALSNDDGVRAPPGVCVRERKRTRRTEDEQPPRGSCCFPPESRGRMEGSISAAATTAGSLSVV